MHIAVVGYGIAGVAAAIHLRRLGHQITHFERSEVDVAGGGLLLQAPAIGLLAELGLERQLRARGAVVDQLCAETTGGRRLLDLRYPSGSATALGIQRQALRALLAAADSGHGLLQRGVRMQGVDPERGVLLAHDQSGHGQSRRDQIRHGPYDLIVAADGANSLLRASLPRLLRRNRLYPWAATVACIDDPGGCQDRRLHQVYHRHQHFAVWPVGNTDAGAPKRVNVAINVARQASDWSAEPAAWRAWAATHCPRLAPLLEHACDSPAPALYTYRDVELRSRVSGRVAFIGDAAHSMGPQLGQGARMALEDAACLGSVLARFNDREQALRHFDQQRTRQLRRYQRLSRWLTPVFQSTRPSLGILREAAYFAVRTLPLLERQAMQWLVK